MPFCASNALECKIVESNAVFPSQWYKLLAIPSVPFVGTAAAVALSSLIKRSIGSDAHYS